jgi:hypothetical protein
VCSNILESVDSTLLTKINPINSSNNRFNPGLMIILTTTCGRFVGCFMISIFGVFGYEYIQTASFTFLFIFNFIIYILVAYKYEDLRVKAISRIIKKNYIKYNN